MIRNRTIPFYAPDGSSLGPRTIEAAERLVAGGYVKPAYGRKGHLKAIFLQCEDGSTPVTAQLRIGTPSSYLQHLHDGHRCWKHQEVRRKDENGVWVDTRGVFLQVVTECLAG